MSNFHPNRKARPAPTPPAAPAGRRPPLAVPPPAVAAAEARKGKAGPRAHVAYVGPPRPSSPLGMVAVCMALIGLQSMADPLTTGGFVFGLVFFVLGLAGCGAWLRMWLLWRAAWGQGRWW